MKQQQIGELISNIPKIFSKYFEVYRKILENNSHDAIIKSDPLQIKNIFIKVFNRILNDPDLLIKYQMSFFKGQLEAIENVMKTFQQSDASYNPYDKRFKDSLWQEHCFFFWIKNAYFTYAKWIDTVIDELPKDDLKKSEIKKVNFVIKQFIEAVSPTNFPGTNPEVLKEFFESSGKNFLQGLDNLLYDVERSFNSIWIKNNDSSKFIIGENIAATKGKVVYKNSLVELIHYKPLTAKQYEIPLLIIPPFINKYYILDLQSENSFVQWLLENNYNVFLVSWINPDESMANTNFFDYMDKGILQVLDYLSGTLGFKQVNTLGYCIGGTLLATTLAYMKCKGDFRIKSASFLATLIDFENAGELSTFVDDHFITEVENYMQNNGGYVDGKDLGNMFNLLRPNEMIWPFYINNYLLGKETFPFDILFWNEDSTRLPMIFHSFYLKNMYKDNLLKIPGGLKINNISIDIASVDIPCYFVATKNDHIVPWINAFNSAKVFNSSIEFILADSGHVAGIINHPNLNKYRYWKGEEIKWQEISNPDEWFNKSTEYKGSWWVEWNDWAIKNSGNLKPAKQPEESNPSILMDAPGAYVHLK